MILLLQIAFIILAQVLMIYGYTKPMARFQVPIVKGMIDYWPIGNKYASPFHRFGWQLAFCFVLMITLAHGSIILTGIKYGFGNYPFLFPCLFTPLICGLWHWKLFDEEMGAALHNNRFYIGETSRLDIWLIKRYGITAGEKKDKMAIEAIVFANLLFVILNGILYAKTIR